MQRCEDCGRVLRASGACPSCDDYALTTAVAERRRPDRDPVALAADVMAAERAIEAAAAYGAEVRM